MINKKKITFFALAILLTPVFTLLNTPLYAQRVPTMPRITKQFLESLKPDPIDLALGFDEPKAFISNKGDWLWGDGNDTATQRNNEALTFVLQNDMTRAREILHEASRKAPQFFPIRFNYGRVLLFFSEHQQALAEFTRARDILPQYWKNYYYMGKAYEQQGDYNSAVYHFKLAYLHNPFDLSSLVALGDLLLERNRAEEAQEIFEYCLSQDNGYNDALIGLGKVRFHSKKYYDAVLLFRAVDRDRPFKKELHFYYAESAFFAQMYPLAMQEYQTMLGYPQDAVFNRISLPRLRQRMSQAKRLSLQEDTSIAQ